MSFSHISIIAGLLISLLISALAVIGSKYQSRLLFAAIQNQEVRLDEYEIEWGRLQLELTTLAEEGRVERVARKQLKLRVPDREKIIYIKEHAQKNFDN